MRAADWRVRCGFLDEFQTRQPLTPTVGRLRVVCQCVSEEIG